MGIKSLPIVLALCVVLALAGCTAVLSSNQVVGSGKLVTQTFALQNFARVNAGSNFKVTLHPGASFAVSITADDNVIQLLSASVNGDELKLDVKPEVNSGFTLVTMKADVSMPALQAVTTGGNAAVHLDKVDGGQLTLREQSNGIIDGEVAVDQLTIDAGSNGQVQLSGSAQQLRVTGQGNAVLRLGDLVAKIARVDLGSNAKATVQATEKLDYAVGGNGGRTYSCGAKLGEHKTEGNAYARNR